MDIAEIIARYQAALEERERLAKQKDLLERKVVANRKRLLDTKDALWAYERGLTEEINSDLWNSSESTTRRLTPSPIQRKALRHVPVKFATDQSTHVLPINHQK
jgi:hypothetical protein